MGVVVSVVVGGWFSGQVQELPPGHLTLFELLSCFISMADSNCADCDPQPPTSAALTESTTDPATFAAPNVLASPRVVIEFCNRVRTRISLRPRHRS
jgi:hypothetical protein